MTQNLVSKHKHAQDLGVTVESNRITRDLAPISREKTPNIDVCEATKHTHKLIMNQPSPQHSSPNIDQRQNQNQTQICKKERDKSRQEHNSVTLWKIIPEFFGYRSETKDEFRWCAVWLETVETLRATNGRNKLCRKQQGHDTQC